MNNGSLIKIMPVCKKCGQYYVRLPCPSCGFDGEEGVPEVSMKQSAVPIIPSPVQKSQPITEETQPSSSTADIAKKPVPQIDSPREESTAQYQQSSHEVELKRLRTELEVLQREYDAYRERVQEAIRGINKLLRSL